MKHVMAFSFVLSLALSMGCGSSPSSSDTTPPDPSTLSATVDFSLVQLSWDQCTSDDFAEYRLYRSTTAGISASPGTPIASFTNVTDLTYNDSAVEQDGTYYYAISTVDDDDLIAWSNEITVETPVEAVAGYWEGTTDQGKPISFYVTTDMTLGELSVLLDITGAPDLTWTFPNYTPYALDGTWSGSGDDGTHSIEISGTFTSSNLFVGSFIASSETYYGGYYIESDFNVYPQ